MILISEWDERHRKKLDWAYKARENLIKDCINKNIFYFEDHSAKSEMMISVYGKSQRGKTTCILSLLGIKNDEILTVSNILRGSREKGKSATSTATIYKKSSTECFGLAFGDHEYLDLNDKALESKMDEVRTEIEANPYSMNEVTIFIPDKYFESSEQGFKYRIVDLPGRESAEEKEKVHVEAQLEKYLMASDSVLIVEAAPHLTDLGRISFAEHGLGIWSKRFKVILTRSFFLESVENKILGKNEEVAYYNLKNYYKHEVCRSLEKTIDEEIEIYPLDLGESLETFIKKFPEQKEMVFKVLSRMRQELLQSISESLTIEDKLIESVNIVKTIQNRVDETEKAREKEIGILQKKIQRAELFLAEKDGITRSIDNENNTLDELNQILDLLMKVRTFAKRSIYGFLNGLKLKSENRTFPIPFSSSVGIASVPKKTVSIDELKSDLLRIRTDIRAYVDEELDKHVFKPISKLKDRNCDKLSIEFKNKILSSNLHEMHQVDVLVDSLFKGIWSGKLRENFSDILVQSLAVYYSSYWEMVYRELSELLVNAEKTTNNIIDFKQKKIVDLAKDKKHKERELDEFRSELKTKENYYSKIIQQYEDDSKVVSKFQEYLDQEFKKEYNRAIIQMKPGASSVWDLAYLSLITNKYDYLRNKLVNKYGKTITCSP